MKITMKPSVLLALLLFAVFIAACENASIQNPEAAADTKSGIETKFEASQELKKFSSSKEIIEYLQKSGPISSGNFRRNGGAAFGIAESAAPMLASKSFEGAVSDSSSAGSSAGSYSQTNVQVQGVDEADFVKNDGKYIYVLSQDKLVIVDAYPADKANVISATEIDGYPRDMFVNKDRVVVFLNDEGEVYTISEYDYVPRPRYTQVTRVVVYDTTDKKNPKKIKDYELNGNYYQSRMIGDYVYFVVQEGVYYYDRFVSMPAVKDTDSSRTIVKPDVYYFDNPESNYIFNTVASFNIFGDSGDINAKTFMMGYTSTMYVSENNLYVAYQKNLPYTYYEAYNEERFYKIVLPLLPSDIQSKISEIKEQDKGSGSYERWSKISAVLEEMYNRMGEKQKEGLIEKIEEAVAVYEAEQEAERRKTVIHKIKIGSGDIRYQSRGEVPGYLLNQFSMDENDGNLRVATTVEIYNLVPRPLPMPAAGSEETAADAKVIAPMPPVQRDWVMYNNVYVLDSSLKIIGKLENIGTDEKIYSARFIGDRLYMVTFRRIDPFFVIDLSSPQRPEVLGELKIPGFSDYLHPYDEDTIIGVGKETAGNEWGGVSVKGVKVALFDVADVKNPKQLDMYKIGEAGTDSEALRDHKAFLFDKEKNLLVIPVTEVKGKSYYDSRYGYYRQKYWQGAYVFGIDGKKLEVKGAVSHNEGDEERDYYWYGSPNAVRRSLFMDDVLYTVSMGKIKMSNIDDAKEVNSIDLPFEKKKYYEYLWY